MTKIKSETSAVRTKWKSWYGRNLKNTLGRASLALAVLGALWGVYATVTVSVIDPHIRKIVREEVPRAMVEYVDQAVTRAAEPHMEQAKRDHELLQKQIDTNSEQVRYNREEREKFQKELMQRDVEHAQALRDMNVKLDRLYELMIQLKENPR